MPELPAFLASRAERWFGAPGIVTAATPLGERLRKVTFEVPALRGKAFTAGQEVELRVSERAFRHYTPAAFDPARGAFDVLFYLHGRGPGSAWAAALSGGTPVRVMGPGGSFGVRPGCASHLFLGDETTIGLFAALTAGARRDTVIGAVEVEPALRAAVEPLVAPLDVVERSATRGDAVLSWLSRATLPARSRTAYLAGHAESIVRLRAALRAAHGYGHGEIRTKAYWADGRRGL